MDAKLNKLRKVKTDNHKWLIYYIDEANNQKWVKEYPESEYHGGGLPQLRELPRFPWED
jgi:hypothetical protein